MSEKILCLGSNTVDSDVRTQKIALDRGLSNLGLISSAGFVPVAAGVYHTSLADLSTGDIVNLSEHFDQVIMLDQPRKEWTHWKLMQSTFKVMTYLEETGHRVQFRNNENVKSLEKINGMVTNNKSWCIYPWINVVSRDEGLMLCARSPTRISDEFSLEKWQQSEQRNQIKNAMLTGEKLPQHCATCYQYENHGIESYRQYESREWLHSLEIDDYSQLEQINSPIYYEVHWSNKCNLKCRGCSPDRSSAIDTEFKKYKIQSPFYNRRVSSFYPGIDIVDIENLRRTSRVYVTGGEPVIMPETIEFMERCVAMGRTDFELTMSTNGVKIPQSFERASRHFSNLNLSFSLDGYDKINDYWRSGADWKKIVANMHRMKSLGHQVTVNTVPGIYNVTNLHLLFEWLDQEFPMTAIYLQINHNDMQSAYNFPKPDLVLESMEKCRRTRVYWSDGKSCRTGIDSIYNHYAGNPVCDFDALRKFFEFNDKLDAVRGVRLGDHIPELEECRSYISR